MEGTKHGQLVAMQLLDVTIRVQAIRNFSVQQCALLLENSYFLTGQPRNTMVEVLYAAAWICGEFSRYQLFLEFSCTGSFWHFNLINFVFCSSELKDPLATLNSMIQSQTSNLPGHIQAVYVHNILKLAATTLCKAEKEEDTDTAEKVE